MRRLPVPSVALIVYSLAAHWVAVVVTHSDGLVSGDPYDRYVVVFLLAVSMVLMAYQALCVSRLRFRVALGTQTAVVCVLILFFGRHDLLTLLLSASLILGAALFDRPPVSTIAGVAISALVVASSALASLRGANDPHALAAVAARAMLLAGLTVVSASMMRYRERLIDSQQQNARLDNVVSQISQVNREYQNSLVEVEASSVEGERRRITRDIHDVVGYTLTNNIMLMEAAIDLMRVDPIRVSRVLQTARENAEEGLRRVRGTLYDLRTRSETVPSGIPAVVKMIATFEAATQVQVVTSFSNTPLRLPASIDLMLYHLVQEALVNSFRHGETTRIDVIVGTHDGMLDVSIRDNGGGVIELDEGIGLRGMSERVHRLGGGLEYGNVGGGFMVRATIPWSGQG